MTQGDELAHPVAGVPTSQEAALGRHLWARGYFAVTSGNITDEMINEYINEQRGEPVGRGAGVPAGSARSPITLKTSSFSNSSGLRPACAFSMWAAVMKRWWSPFHGVARA
jgi:hypothetical protein